MVTQVPEFPVQKILITMNQLVLRLLSHDGSLDKVYLENVHGLYFLTNWAIKGVH